MDEIQKKSERLKNILKDTESAAISRNEDLKNLEEGVKLLEEESKKFEQESNEFQKMFMKKLIKLIGAALTTVIILIVVVFIIL